MSLLGKMVTKTVEIGIKRAVTKATWKELNERRSTDSLAENCEYANCLIIEEKLLSLTKNIVYDANHNEKYTIMPIVPFVGSSSWKLIDLVGEELGSVCKVPFTPCYAVSIYGKEIGTVTKINSQNLIFETDYINWNVKGNMLQLDYVALDNRGKIVLKVHSAFWSGTNAYVMEYPDARHELLGLLLLMAIALIRSK